VLIPNLRELFGKAFKNWQEDDGPRLSAALAFYAMLSLAPMLVLSVAVASRFLDDSVYRPHVIKAAKDFLGGPGSELINNMIDNASKPSANAIASLLSVGVALLGASGLFDQLKASVNHIWNARSTRTGIKGFLLGKLLSLLSFLAFAVAVLAWLGLDSWLGWLERHTMGFQGFTVISVLISIFFFNVVFAISFRALPKGMVAWGDVWIGAFFTAVAIALSKYLLGLYFQYSGLTSAYGPAGALVVILLWIYYSGQIYFFGLEITCTYAHLHGSQCHRKKGEPPVPVGTGKALGVGH
jgi:membrane protein